MFTFFSNIFFNVGSYYTLITRSFSKPEKGAIFRRRLFEEIDLLGIGSIPIVTDCPEMRHFEDMPLVYCPKDFNEITNEWLDKAKESVKDKSTERLRMSYWENHLNEMKSKYGI